MTITVTKTDVARSQIDTAIELWFGDRDPVSVHTLACAGLDVMNALGTPLGELAMRYDPSRFKEGMFKDWLLVITEIRNFFKHADRNPEGTLDFKPSTNKYLLADCVDTFRRVSGGQTAVMQAYWAYFVVHNPRYFSPVGTKPIPVEFSELSKEQFLEGFLSEFGQSASSEE